VETLTWNHRASSADSSTLSISRRGEEDASPSGQRRPSRSTTSTAPGSSGSRASYRVGQQRHRPAAKRAEPARAMSPMCGLQQQAT
jgi:hypothetical protein